MTGAVSDEPEEYVIRPIGHVRGGRTEPIDDQWGPVTATIARWTGQRYTTDVVAGLDAFSHVEVVYLFDQVDEASVQLGARHRGSARTGRWSACSPNGPRCGPTGSG